MRRQGGFTLIEVVLVMALIALLALVVLPKFANHKAKAADTSTKANLESLRTAIDTFVADGTGVYPTNLATDLVSGSVQYLRRIPTDGKKRAATIKAAAGSPIVVGDIDDAGGWVYDKTAGHVVPNLSGTDVDGIAYLSY